MGLRTTRPFDPEERGWRLRLLALAWAEAWHYATSRSRSVMSRSERGPKVVQARLSLGRGYSRPMIRVSEFLAWRERCTYGHDRVRPVGSGLREVA